MLGPAIDFKPRNNENGHFSCVPFHVSACPLPTHPFCRQTDTTVKYLIKEFTWRPKYLMMLQVLKTLMESALNLKKYYRGSSRPQRTVKKMITRLEAKLLESLKSHHTDSDHQQWWWGEMPTWSQLLVLPSSQWQHPPHHNRSKNKINPPLAPFLYDTSQRFCLYFVLTIF